MAQWWQQLQQLGQSLTPQQRAIRARLAQNPYGRLRSPLEVAIAAELGLTLDANSATVDDWLRLPEISIHQARALVALTSNGVQFLCLEDLAAALALPLARLAPYAPLLRFTYQDPASVVAPIQLNANTATPAQLAAIPVLNAALIAQLVGDRTAHGPYQSLADLQQRLRLNPELIAQLMYYLKF
ncbi:MAG: ComEA family DNA-binding protein [Spirulina sp. DLM2.Bin59]|nr:MAG: ComEA family DNA-binding protein [Spirulina sp. DLM2.Bin59]